MVRDRNIDLDEANRSAEARQEAIRRAAEERQKLQVPVSGVRERSGGGEVRGGRRSHGLKEVEGMLRSIR